MNDLRRTISAELLKLKRTLALRLAIGAPLIVVLLNFVVYIQGRDRTPAGVNPLIPFAQINLTMWTILVLPMYAALSAALVAAVDHQGNNWKHLFALPIARRSIYLAKWIAGFVLLAVSSLAFATEVTAGAAVLRIVKPAWRSAPIPAGLVAVRALESGLATALVLSIQMWVSLRFRSFVAGLAVGIGGVLVLLAGVARSGLGTIIVYLYPWALAPTAMSRLAEVHRDRAFATLWGLAAGAIIALAGALHLSSRDTF